MKLVVAGTRSASSCAAAVRLTTKCVMKGRGGFTRGPFFYAGFLLLAACAQHPAAERPHSTESVLVSARGVIEDCLQSWQEKLDVKATFHVVLFLNKDGTLSKPPELPDEAKLSNGDGHHKELADELVLALQQCAPFDLPADRYEMWSLIDLRLASEKPAGR